MSPRVRWHSKRAGLAGPFAYQRGRQSRPLSFEKRSQKRRNALKGRLARGGWGGGSHVLSAIPRSFLSLKRVNDSGKSPALPAHSLRTLTRGLAGEAGLPPRSDR